MRRVRPPLRFDDLGRGFRTHRFLAWSAIATGRALRGNGANYRRSDGCDHTNRLVRRDLNSWVGCQRQRSREPGREGQPCPRKPTIRKVKSIVSGVPKPDRCKATSAWERVMFWTGSRPRAIAPAPTADKAPASMPRRYSTSISDIGT